MRRREVWLAAALAASATGFLAWGVWQGNVMRYASDPSRGVALNLAVHQFEHLLDLAPLLLAARWVDRGPA
ncbi:MAG: hypothetical protein M5U26_19440 [Planctomycetota bacterium]|nr:hypothetical protein [Planctomycetota bacterium]